MRHHLLQVFSVALLVFAAGWPLCAQGSGTGQVIGDVANVPPETKVRMLRIIFEDVFGTPAELKAKFVAACDARTPSAATASSPATASKAPEPASMSASRKATLAALCVPSVRRGVESALSFKEPASAAQAPAPSSATNKALARPAPSP